MSDFQSWARAVVDETQALLDHIGENGEAILAPGSDGTAAVAQLLELVTAQHVLMVQMQQHVAQAQQWLAAPLGEQPRED